MGRSPPDPALTRLVHAAEMHGRRDAVHDIIMAGSMFGVAPVLAVFVVAQRHIIRAFTFTSLK